MWISDIQNRFTVYQSLVLFHQVSLSLSSSLAPGQPEEEQLLLVASIAFVSYYSICLSCIDKPQVISTARLNPLESCVYHGPKISLHVHDNQVDRHRTRHDCALVDIEFAKLIRAPNTLAGAVALNGRGGWIDRTWRARVQTTSVHLRSTSEVYKCLVAVLGRFGRGHFASRGLSDHTLLAARLFGGITPPTLSGYGGMGMGDE